MFFQVSQCSTIGCRPVMEDTANYSVDAIPYFAVHDGHAGSEISTRLQKDIPDLVSGIDFNQDVEQQCTKKFMELNSKYLELDTNAGSTSVLVFYDGKFLHCCNVGDSEAYLFDSEGNYLELSKKHRPNSERELIESKKGFVALGRVNGILAVSRAFGDKGLSEFITAEPHYSKTLLEAKHTYLVLASDGLFDAVGPDEIPRFLTAEKLLRRAFDEESRDNITVQVVKLWCDSTSCESKYLTLKECCTQEVVPIPMVVPDNLFMKTLDAPLTRSYFYVNDPTILPKLEINVELPMWISQELISSKLYGNCEVLKKAEALYKRYFVWATEFSNIHATFHFEERSIEIDGETYPGPEQFFQIQKSVGTSDENTAREAIMKTSPAKSLGLGKSFKLRNDWEHVKDYMMFLAIKAKFTQYEDLTRLLKETGDNLLVYLKPTDSYWGTGNDGLGLNKMGETLTKVRNHF